VYGHEGISRDLRRRVLERLPARLAMIRAATGATVWELPDPVQVIPYFLPDIDVEAYPTICLTELDTPAGLTGARQMRRGTSYDAFVYRYPARIFAYLMTENYGVGELQLKRYLTAIREVILENRVLADTDSAYVTFDPETITEDFDSPLEDEARQVLAAGYVGVVMESTEIVNRSGPGGDLEITGSVAAMDRTTGERTGRPVPLEEVELWQS
jgi:hypothetical protein